MKIPKSFPAKGYKRVEICAGCGEDYPCKSDCPCGTIIVSRRIKSKPTKKKRGGE